MEAECVYNLQYHLLNIFLSHQTDVMEIVARLYLALLCKLSGKTSLENRHHVRLSKLPGQETSRKALIIWTHVVHYGALHCGWLSHVYL